MYVNIPLSNQYGQYTEKVSLDGTIYMLSFRWNERMGKWLMDILDATSAVLVAGIPLLTSAQLVNRFVGRIAGLPAGNFYVIDNTNQGADPDLSSLGVTTTLIYASTL